MSARRTTMSPANIDGASRSSGLRLGRGTGEVGAGTAPKPASPEPICLICDGPADEAAVLAGDDGRPMRMISVCAGCLAIADALGLSSKLETGKS